MPTTPVVADNDVPTPTDVPSPVQVSTPADDVVVGDCPVPEEPATTLVVAEDTEQPSAVGDSDGPHIPAGDMFGRFAHKGGAIGPHDTA